MQKAIYLAPLDNVPTVLQCPISAHVEGTFAFPVQWKPVAVPMSQAYHPARHQYHAGTLLKLLTQVLPSDAIRLVGLTMKDLYERGLNFVFGEAQSPGPVAVVSLYRLQDVDPTIFTDRVRKEVTHELGHTFGLRHCPNPVCVMSFSNSLADVDRKSAFFCQRCQRLLEKNKAFLLS